MEIFVHIPSLNFQNYYQLDNSKITEIKNNLVNADVVDVKIIFDEVQLNTKYGSDTILPLVLEIFRVGIVGDGEEYVLESRFRLELEETGVDTGIFTGTIAFQRITAKNILTFDYSQLDTFTKNVIFPSFPYVQSSYPNPPNDNSLEISYYDYFTDAGYAGPLLIAPITVNSHAIFQPISIITDEETPVSFQLDSDDFWRTQVDVANMDEGKITFDSNTEKFTFIPTDNYFGTVTKTIHILEKYLPNKIMSSSSQRV